MPLKRSYFSSSFVHDQLREVLDPSIDKNALVRKLSAEYELNKHLKKRWSVLGGELTKDGKPLIVLFNKNIDFGNYMHFSFYRQNIFIPFGVMKVCGGLKSVMYSVFRGWGDRIVEDLKADYRWDLLTDLQKLRFVQGISISDAITNCDLEALKDIEEEKSWMGKE
jgi:hypothetical protein